MPPHTDEATASPPAYENTATYGAQRPLLVSVDGMAHMLGISRREAYRLLDSQQVESRWKGRRRLIPMASIEAFAAALPTERA